MVSPTLAHSRAKASPAEAQNLLATLSFMLSLLLRACFLAEQGGESRHQGDGSIEASGRSAGTRAFRSALAPLAK